MKSFLLVLCVALSVVGCNSSKNMAKLSGVKWVLQTLNDKELSLTDPNSEIFIQFNEAEHRVNGRGGCNRFFGNYEMESSRLKFSLCLTAMNITAHASTSTVCHAEPKSASMTGQQSIADTVDSDMYFVVRSSTTIISMVSSPTRQSMTKAVESPTRKPLPPLKPYQTGYA